LTDLLNADLMLRGNGAEALALLYDDGTVGDAGREGG
jgi:hypothetical protein